MDRPTDHSPMSGEMSRDESFSPKDQTLKPTTTDMLKPQNHHKRGL